MQKKCKLNVQDFQNHKSSGNLIESTVMNSFPYDVNEKENILIALDLNK